MGFLRSFNRDIRKWIEGYNLNLILIDPVRDEIQK